MATPDTSPEQRFALMSVYDKTGIVPFARALSEMGYGIISTGGTARALTEVAAPIPVIPIEQFTGFPECFGGRIKTLSPYVEGGILFDRKNPTDVEEAAKLGIRPIDIVVCNLYPFETTVAKPNATLAEAIEMIDVGGPTMIRAAAKNWENVLAVSRPEDYGEVLEALQHNNRVSDALRFRLAQQVFSETAYYDGAIARYMRDQLPHIK